MNPFGAGRGQFRDGQAGFTLMELLIAIAILGTIATALSTGIVVGLRTFGGTDNKIRSSVDAQLLSVYLPPDLQSVGNGSGDLVVDPAHTSSTPAGNFSTDGSNTDCSDAGPQQNFLRLRWATAAPAAVHTYVAAYVLAESPPGNWKLTRYYCVDGGAPVRTTLVRNLRGGGATDAEVAVDAVDPRKVTVRLRSRVVAPGDATTYSYEISGIRRTQ